MAGRGWGGGGGWGLGCGGEYRRLCASPLHGQIELLRSAGRVTGPAARQAPGPSDARTRALNAAPWMACASGAPPTTHLMI